MALPYYWQPTSPNYPHDVFDRMTGTTGFDICHWHGYGGPTIYHDGLVAMVHMADTVNKPGNVGECGDNSVYPIEIWPELVPEFIAHGYGAYAWLDLVGTSGYPYTGSYPVGEALPQPPPAPSISILASQSYGAYPYSVTFTSTVINGVAPFTYYWTFDDGSHSTNANPSHTFTSAGLYHVYATVSGGGSGTSNSITITVTSPYLPTPPVIAPTVTIQANRTSGASSMRVSFLSSVVDGQAPFTYYWTFDDGVHSSNANPSHIFATGVFHVYVTISGGGTDISNVITISSLSPGPINGSGNELIIADPLAIVPESSIIDMIQELSTTMAILMIGVTLSIIFISIAFSTRFRR